MWVIKEVRILVSMLFLFTVLIPVVNSASCIGCLFCGTCPGTSPGVRFGADCCYDCGVTDGVCPEDFGANCAGAPDEDCGAYMGPPGDLNLTGFLLDTYGNPISNMNLPYIRALNGTFIRERRVLESSGGYFWLPVDANTQYDVVFSANDYEPKVMVLTTGIADINLGTINLRRISSECKPDCTRHNDICDATCDGWNGCVFPQIMKAGCDGRQKDFKDPFTNRLCCTGEKEPTSVVGDPVLEVDAENIVKSVRLAILDGKSVEVHIAIFK